MAVAGYIKNSDNANTPINLNLVVSYGISTKDGGLSVYFETVYGRILWKFASAQAATDAKNLVDTFVAATAQNVTYFTLTYTAGANGTVTGPSPQTVASGGSGQAVTAVPNAGKAFVNWSDASVQNPRTDTNVSGNVTVTANFA
jgi:hypothetical protein